MDRNSSVLKCLKNSHTNLSQARMPPGWEKTTNSEALLLSFTVLRRLGLENRDSTAVSIFVDILVELTNSVFVNRTNTSTNIETAVLSS